MARWLQETRASPKSGEIRSLLTPSEGWLTVLLLFGVQITPVVAVHTSNWADPSPRLWLIAIAGFVIGLSAAKAGGRGAYLAAALLGAALGAGLALWETAGTLSGPLGGRFGEVFDRVDAWIGAIGDAGGISNDRLPFGFGLAVLSFAMPFLSTLLYFRYHWGWPAVIIPALVLLTNQTYLPNSHYVVPTFFFLLLSILFLGRIYYLSRLEHWRQQGTKRVAGRYSFVMNVAALTAVVFAAGWSIPNTDVVIPKLRDAYQDARGPWRGLEDEFERVFAGIPSKRGSPLHSFGGALPLRGGINPGYGPCSASSPTSRPTGAGRATTSIRAGAGSPSKSCALRKTCATSTSCRAPTPIASKKSSPNGSCCTKRPPCCSPRAVPSSSA